jgi:hypothetical protein
LQWHTSRVHNPALAKQFSCNRVSGKISKNLFPRQSHSTQCRSSGAALDGPVSLKNCMALAPAFSPLLARVLSAAVNGIEAFPVKVEVNCGWGDTMIIIVGLPGRGGESGLLCPRRRPMVTQP